MPHSRSLLVAAALACSISPLAASSAQGAAPGGKAITTGRSEFGQMIFDTRGQAIYAFERDRRNKSACFDACAEAWPPVYTKMRPRARGAVKASLLGSIKRGDRRQVTYAGRPLYFYVNESPGEVLCHNVFLNGGLWWVIGPDGKNRA